MIIDLDDENKPTQWDIQTSQDTWDMATRLAQASRAMYQSEKSKEEFMVRRELGIELRLRRYQLGMTPEQTAAKAAIPYEMMSHIEGGFVSNEELQQYIEPLSKALHLDPAAYLNRIPQSDVESQKRTR